VRGGRKRVVNFEFCKEFKGNPIIDERG